MMMTTLDTLFFFFTNLLHDFVDKGNLMELHGWQYQHLCSLFHATQDLIDKHFRDLSPLVRMLVAYFSIPYSLQERSGPMSNLRRWMESLHTTEL